MGKRQRWVRHAVSDRPLLRWLEDARQDLRYALRHHRGAPGFAALIVVTLAIGIGANATMAAAIDRLLLRAPAHVRDPDRVVRLLLVAPNPLGGEHVSARSNYPTFLDLKREVASFEAIGAYSPARLSFGEGREAVEARASLVSGSFFSVFGVNAAIGRLFTPADDSESRGTPIAVLGHGFWQRELGSDTSIVGRTVRIGSLTYTVVGVTPAGFRGVESHDTDVWLPITIAAEREARIPLSLEDRGSAWLSIVARLRRGAMRASAEQEATNVWREYSAPPGSREVARRIVAASVIRGRGPDRPRDVNVALWLTGVSTLLLLIACANVANLLLARAFARRREIAVRLALGAGRGRLARQMLAEAMLLAGLAGAAALYLAVLGGRLVQRWLLYEGAEGEFLDVRLFGITAAIALATGVLISLAPLIQSASPDLTRSLRVGVAAGGGRASRVRMALLGTQAALCMMLLIAAGLFAQSLRRVEGLDLGLDLERTLMARIELGRAALPQGEIEATYAAMLQRVRALDGVSHAALAEHDPYIYGRAVAAHTPTRSAESLWHEGVLEVPMEVAVDSGFFRAVGATSLRGRDFEATDQRGAPRVAIINEPLAKLLWPGEEPLGQCMLVSWEGGDCVTVVGILRGFWKFSILEREKLIVYVPMAQGDGYTRAGSMFIAVRGDPAVVSLSVRQAIQSVRPDLPAVSVARMRDIVDPQFRPWQLAANMFGIFGGIALLIATVGLYGVVTFATTQRLPEIAIRTALGARPAHVLSLVASDALRAVAAGLGVGALVVLAVRGWVGPLLFQTSPGDPGIVIAVGALLLSVALVASLIPTMRALRRSPATVLRVE